MSSQVTVNVSGISPTTSETALHDFFRIQSIDLKPGDGGEKKSAVIHFEKHSAANTALMLNGGPLDGSPLTVTSDTVHHDDHDKHDGAEPFDQSDKPRAGIAAEYLAKGYKLSDHILNRAIEIDNKQGISKRFLSYMQGLDTSVGQRALGPDQTISGKVQSTLRDAHTRAKSVDEQKGYTKVAHEYYSKALSSPFGQSVLSFYTSTSKQVFDIHEEARRIADQHKAPEPTRSPTGGSPAVAASAPAVTSTDAVTSGSEVQPDPAVQAAPTVV
ncbi:hypothetical protein BV22DRAFT_1104679 [Leucogyrophana mollusca]|uniref:Uncharacterized protein n=1 Tax=Leucogyrophana mollusca TaxID=85980 RepID=A0ACB8BK61_9AGAM|nr:hypothetical protein BV22DRAFT_1104679 [Leucogyrophana mollusca]